MARASFVISQTYLQKEPPVSGDNDSALKGDGYVSSPTSPISAARSFFDAKATDYGQTEISWGIGTTLQTTVGVTPVPTQVVIRYDTLGEPQTVANGTLVTTITPDRLTDTITHGDLPEGVWVYYSLFVRYDSTDVRSWYEKVASVKVLMPARLNSREMLWRRIPMHHRIQDGSDSGPVSVDSDLFANGPLYRMMDVIGWDIDKLRTLINHQMVTRDPYLATPEALDALAEELGVQLSSQDLGTTRLRDLLSGINYLRAYKGTAQGVREWITAITGSDVEIRPTSASVNALTTQQSTFSTIVVNTNPAAQPTGNQWVIEPVSGGTATSGSYGVQIVGAGASYGVAVLKTRISDTKNDSWYRMLYDLTVPSGASVIGVQMSTSVIPAASVTVDPATGEPLTYPDKFVLAFSGADTWYEAPVEIGLAGNGTHTTTPMFLHIFVTAKAGGTVNLNNIKLRTDDRFPYFIDVFSQRVNLCRDPKFVTGNYWGRTAYSAPNVFSDAIVALDPKYSVANESIMQNYGTGSSALGASYGPSTARPTYLNHTGTNYLYVPSSGGANLVSIAAAEETISGDIEMVCRWAADNWKTTTNQPMITRRAASPNYGWYWLLTNTSGVPVLSYSLDGSSGPQSLAASVPAFVNGTTYWHKVTREAATGITSYYYANDSANEPTTWIQIASGTNGSAGNLFATRAPIDIAGNQPASQSAAGKWYRAIVRRGIGASATTVVDLDFTTSIKTGDELDLAFTGTAASAGYLDNAMFISNLGTAGNALDMRVGNVFTGQFNTTPDWFEPKYVSHTGTNHLYLQGFINGNSAVTAPSATIPTTSLSVRAAVHPNTWRPTVPNTGASTQYAIASQYSSTSNQRSWLLWISETGALQLLLSPLSTGGSSVNLYTASTPISASAGLLGVRADWAASTGAITFYTRNVVTAASSGSEIKDNTGWIQVGASISSGITQLNTNTQPITIGSHSGGQNLFAGKYYASYIEVDGTSVLDINFPSKITSGANTSFVEDSPRASTVSIQRASVGSKPVCVTRPLWLFGADGTNVSDYLTTVRTSDALDINETDSFTAFISMRQWATPQSGAYIFGNRDVSSPFAGWNIRQDNNNFRIGVDVDDGPTSGTTSLGITYGAGSLVTNGFTFNRSSQSLTAFTGASTGASAPISTIPTIVTTTPLVIGRYATTSSGYTDMEFYGAAIWKRALTSAEQTTVRNYFDGTETPEALALLAEAIFWIDPKRSVQRASIIRNTATTALKPACVTRPILLFDGSNDYLQIPDNDLLDITAGKSMTVLAIVRQNSSINTFGRFVSKRDFTVGTRGWEVANNSNTYSQYSAVDNGVGASVVFSGGSTNRLYGSIVEGRVNAVGFILNRSTPSLRQVSNTTLNATSYLTSPSVPPAADTSNSLPVTIGGAFNSVGTSGGFQSFELLGVYIWNRALSQSELNTVVAHATAPGTIVTYSPTGSLGASANTGTNISFYSIGNTPIRQGIPYYFSVTDVYNNITSVELWSNAYGQLDVATATSYQKNFADGARRKTWELTREYSSPWLPLNISDCYIKINGNTDTTRTIVMKDPLFEPLNTSGEYFDGNNVNGGWLSGATASSGVADYRWGDAGANISFSYYTSDYQRTVSTLFRLLDTILPVTQTGNNTSLVKLDRIYGYTGTDRP